MRSPQELHESNDVQAIYCSAEPHLNNAELAAGQDVKKKFQVYGDSNSIQPSSAAIGKKKKEVSSKIVE